jgi:hypothetical protein
VPAQPVLRENPTIYHHRCLFPQQYNYYKEIDPMLQSTSRQHKIIWISAWIAALDCLAVALLFSLNQPRMPSDNSINLWPTPGYYFIELAILAVLVLSAVPNLISSTTGLWHPVPWIAAGIMLTFVILGALSIGIFLFPALLAFMLIAVLEGGHDTHYNPLNDFAYLLLSLFLLALLIIGTWSLGSSLTILFLAAGIVILSLAAARLPQNSIWEKLSFFFIGGLFQTLLMYLLL